MHREDQFIPHLIVPNGLAAIEFYKSVFGAEEGHRMMAPDGKRLMHGEIVLDGHKFFLSDAFVLFSDLDGDRWPDLFVANDSVANFYFHNLGDGTFEERAVAAGAQVLMPLQDLFWGARYGKILDPFGHEWGINQQLKEQTDEETKAAADEFLAQHK